MSKLKPWAPLQLIDVTLSQAGAETLSHYQTQGQMTYCHCALKGRTDHLGCKGRAKQLITHLVFSHTELLCLTLKSYSARNCLGGKDCLIHGNIPQTLLLSYEECQEKNSFPERLLAVKERHCRRGGNALPIENCFCKKLLCVSLWALPLNNLLHLFQPGFPYL